MFIPPTSLSWAAIPSLEPEQAWVPRLDYGGVKFQVFQMFKISICRIFEWLKSKSMWISKCKVFVCTHIIHNNLKYSKRWRKYTLVFSRQMAAWGVYAIKVYIYNVHLSCALRDTIRAPRLTKYGLVFIIRPKITHILHSWIKPLKVPINMHMWFFGDR